ncbi:MAG: glycosyltransferase [Acidobacteria bacterium]|nr:glycosyltransferase [Acidobacteriota bacterium]
MKGDERAGRAWDQAKSALARGDFPGVAAACEEVLALNPEHARALNLGGLAAVATGETSKGLAALRRSLRLEPANPFLWLNLGAGLLQGGLPGAAAEAYGEALGRGAGAEAHQGLVNARLAQGRWMEARVILEGPLRRHGPSNSTRLFVMNYDPALSPRELLSAHRAWAAGLPPPPRPRPVNPDPERRLRVGFVSPDFRRHSCAHFLKALWTHHDRSRVELFVYSGVLAEDDWTEGFRRGSDAWRDVRSLDHGALARQIRGDQVDILLDLSGHTAGNRLPVFAARPAPLQLTWLGYPGSTGLDCFDGRITDALADPPGTLEAVSEPLLRLSRFLAFTPPAEAPAPAPPPSLASGEVTFGSFNSLAKLNEDVLGLWSRILKELPGSTLLLKARGLGEAESAEGLRTAFSAQGVPPERLRVLPWVPGTVSHLEAYAQVDVALDPFPYNGTTTTCEALWMGVPVVSLAGDRHAGRVGASLFAAAGLEGWVSGGPEAYLRRAVELASNPQHLAALRADLRPRLARSPLLDGASFARDMEGLFRSLWRRICGAEA